MKHASGFPCLLISLAALMRSTAAEPKNVIFILADDLGWADAYQQPAATGSQAHHV